MGRLSATAVKAATRPGRLGDGDGLYLIVQAGGTKSWLCRVQKHGVRRDFGLGSASKVPLALARERAREIRTWVEMGLDPLFERRKAKGIPTFKEAAAKVLAAHRKTWRNEKHEGQWLQTLEAYVFPHIGNVQVSEISGPMIRNLLAEIWLAKPETARRVRQRIGTVLDWAYASGFREHEAPMRAITRGLPHQPKKDGHFAAMPYALVPAFMVELAKRESFSRLALAFAILTAARSGEVRCATWDEIDLEAKLWTLPKERMKANREHVVPLTAPAIRIITRCAELRFHDNALLFPGMRGQKPMSDMTLTQLLRKMNQPYTAHGFRSAFRDWASEETQHPGDVAEAALAHTAKGYQSDYDLLIIVNDKRLTERVDYWLKLEDRLNRELAITKTLKTPVNFIVHTLQEVNDGLAHGRYFFMDVQHDGVALYQFDDSELHTPKPKTPEQALAMAQEYFEDWAPTAQSFFRGYGHAVGDGDLKKAAFDLHQATERLYHCVLLVCTFYTPHVHNIGFLRTQAERLDRRLVDVWPRERRIDQARWEKLKEAYVKARYSKHYRISAEELAWLGARVEELGRVVHSLCSERITELKKLSGTAF